jgi:outer membrane protein OmpA-like peptidoglycan-associated protein
MISSTRHYRASRLLAGAAMVTMTALSQSSVAVAEPGRSIVIAQAAEPPAAHKPEDRARQQQQRQEQRHQPQAPAAQQQQQPPRTAPTAQQPQPHAPATAQQPHPQAPATAQQPKPQAPAAAQQPQLHAPATAQQPQGGPPAPTAQEHRDERRDQRRPGQPQQAPTAQQPAAQAPATAQQPKPQAPATAQQPKPQAPATAQQPQGGPPAPTAQEHREERRDQHRPGQPQQAPTAQQPAPQAPATAQQPRPQTPATAQQPAPQTPPTAQQLRPQAPATAQQPQPQAPATAQQPGQQQAPAVVQRNPAAVAPPTQTRDAGEFIRRDARAPAPKIDDLRKSRQEVREGDRTIIREGDRTIVRENNTTVIHHNETNRFVINATNVHPERRGGDLETIVQRSGGYNIVNITDANGRLIRRVRRDPRGREIVIIDNSFIGTRPVNMFVQLPEPVIRIPREHYIVEMGRARPDDIYGVFMAPPVEPLAERYTLDQVRFSGPLRDRMPRVDLDINFETASWQLAPEQVDKLSVIADGINRALQRNPGEVFMIEGYTDAVGSDEDNLSLSDRRAESVAVALTEQFNVPPENLVTQGYGKQFLKVNTPGAEEANRRVAVRRITPLIDGPQAANVTR